MDEGLEGGQEFRCAKEGLCIMDDAQSAVGFGGRHRNVAFPIKIVAVSETQEFE